MLCVDSCKAMLILPCILMPAMYVQIIMIYVVASEVATEYVELTYVAMFNNIPWHFL